MIGRTGRRAAARALALAFVLLAAGVPLDAQSRSRQRPRPTPKVAPKREPAQIMCPATLGTGVKTRRVFCDVLTGRDPADGILIKIPPHTGVVTLTFDLHARHTYSEEQVKAGRGFARYIATVGILTMNNHLVQRAAVESEFRTIADAFDRIGGGAGPGGVKALIPVSIEPVTMVLPTGIEQVSLLGEKVRIIRAGGESTVAAPGQAVAIVSNIQVEYQPKPAPKRREIDDVSVFLHSYMPAFQHSNIPTSQHPYILSGSSLSSASCSPAARSGPACTAS